MVVAPARLLVCLQVAGCRSQVAGRRSHLTDVRSIDASSLLPPSPPPVDGDWAGQDAVIAQEGQGDPESFA